MIHANTPTYVGSHVTGFANMCKGMVDYFAEPSKDEKKQVNILPGWVEPSDMREIKCLAHKLGVNIVMFPDTSDVLDAPQTGTHEFYPRGGATIEQLKSAGSSTGAIGLGPNPGSLTTALQVGNMLARTQFLATQRTLYT